MLTLDTIWAWLGFEWTCEEWNGCTKPAMNKCERCGSRVCDDHFFLYYGICTICAD